MHVRLTLVILLSLSCLLFPACSKKSDAAKAADSTKSVPEAGLEHGAVPLEKTAERVTLKLKFQPGEQFAYSIRTKEAVKITREMRDTLVDENTTEITYRYKFKVLEDRNDGGARLEATCIGVKVDGSYKDPNSNKSMHFDSDDKKPNSDERLFANYSSPVNKPYQFEIAKDGKVESVYGVDSIVKKIVGQDFATTKFEMRKKLVDYYSTMLKNVVQLAFQKVEDRPIGVDSSWVLRSSGDLGWLKLDNKATYTLKGFQRKAEGRLAHIAIKTESSYVGPKKMDTGQGFANMSVFNHAGNGSSIFNIDQGKPEVRVLKQKVFIRFFVEIPEDLKKAAPGQAMDFWMSQDASVENEIRRITL